MTSPALSAAQKMLFRPDLEGLRGFAVLLVLGERHSVLLRR